MLKIDIGIDPIIIYAKTIGKIQLAEKWEMLITFIVGIPLMLVCVAPLATIIFNTPDFYTNIKIYLYIILWGAISSIIVGVFYYWKNYKAIKEIQKYLNELEI